MGYVRYHTPSFKIGGWNFAAVIDHTYETGNIIRALPNETIPDKFKETSPICEHCNINRYRKDTYVLRSDDEEFKQVGKTCLKDFTGHDPMHLARLAEYIGAMREDINSGMQEIGGGFRITYDLQKYLLMCAKSIRQNGWVSRSVAKDDSSKLATADDALNMYNKGVCGWLKAAEEDKNLVMAALAWAESLFEKEDKSEYEYNISIIAGSEFIEPRSCGLAASIVGVYVKNEERKRIQAGMMKGDFIGEVGQKIKDLPVKVLVKRYIDSGFGSTMCKFSDKDGNILTWFATTNTDFQIDDHIVISAKIKKHDVYQGVKSTLISHCKVNGLMKNL